MAKVKIQSAEDIVRAYLMNMGYERQTDLQEFVRTYSYLFQGNNVIGEMDNIVCKAAHSVLHVRLNKTQLIACYKAVFIRNRLAEKFALAPLLPNFKNKDYARIFQKDYFEAVPICKTSDMPVQEITAIHLHNEKNKEKSDD